MNYEVICLSVQPLPENKARASFMAVGGVDSTIRMKQKPIESFMTRRKKEKPVLLFGTGRENKKRQGTYQASRVEKETARSNKIHYKKNKWRRGENKKRHGTRQASRVGQKTARSNKIHYKKNKWRRRGEKMGRSASGCRK